MLKLELKLNLSKRDIFMVGYYFAIIFLVACVLYDVISSSITGFTFGYAFAIFYFIQRAKTVYHLTGGNDESDH